MDITIEKIIYSEEAIEKISYLLIVSFNKQYKSHHEINRIIMDLRDTKCKNVNFIRVDGVVCGVYKFDPKKCKLFFIGIIPQYQSLTVGTNVVHHLREYINYKPIDVGSRPMNNHIKFLNNSKIVPALNVKEC